MVVVVVVLVEEAVLYIMLFFSVLYCIVLHCFDYCLYDRLSIMAHSLVTSFSGGGGECSSMEALPDSSFSGTVFIRSVRSAVSVRYV